ncbi:NAD(P)H-hydrate dehydratase [bacterium]|nr:NAD(P)H-hydrate dehydratase [bacterium]
MDILVTAAEMRELDRLAIEKHGIPGLVLMEHAAAAVAAAADDILEGKTDSRIALFCGKGNNGGDGLAAARLLDQMGYDLTVFVCADPQEIKGDARENYQVVKKLNLDICVLKKPEQLNRIGEYDLLIDALLGTGIAGEVKGFLADVIEWMNGYGAPILAVDIPSGIHADTGQFEGMCIEADATVTFGAMKRGLVFSPARELTGEIEVADIGIPAQAMLSIPFLCRMADETDCRERLPVRPAFAHKGDFGKTAVIAGSPGMTGAAALTSLGALKAGCGLVILGCPEGLNDILEVKLTEVMTRALPETAKGTLSPGAWDSITELNQWADVLAVGPGLSRDSETAKTIQRIVHECHLPLVLDADGLNAFENRADLLKQHAGPLICTPHHGELARIAQCPVHEIDRDPVAAAGKWATELGCVLVLKGAPTVIGDPGGHIFVNSSGNSGMATGGSGDVLTGLITGLLAQGCSALDAAVCGVYLHGLAGDLAAEADSEPSILAGDILKHVGPAFRHIWSHE